MPATLLVLLAAVCFGSTGTAVALGAPDASPTSVGAARIVVGGVLLAAVATPSLLTRQHTSGDPAGSPSRSPAQAQAPARARARPVALAAVVVAGALGVVAYQPLFFTGTRANGVAVGTVAALGSAPLLTGALAWLLTGAHPGRRWLAATAVAVAGLGVLALGGAAHTTAAPATGPVVDLPGLAASLGAAASYAVYTLAAKRLLDAGWTPASSVGALFGGAAALSLPVLLTSDLGWLLDPATRASAGAAVLWLGVVTTTVAYVLFSRGLRYLPAASVATLTLAEPLTATVLGLVVLHERFTGLDVAALLMLAAGLVVLAVPRRRCTGTSSTGGDAHPVEPVPR